MFFFFSSERDGFKGLTIWNWKKVSAELSSIHIYHNRYVERHSSTSYYTAIRLRNGNGVDRMLEVIKSVRIEKLPAEKEGEDWSVRAGLE